MELAKLDVFVCIETLRSTYDRLDSKSYRAAHKPRLTTRHQGSKRGKRVPRKEGERYDERNIVSTVKWGGGAMSMFGMLLKGKLREKGRSARKVGKTGDEFANRLVRNMKKRSEAVSKARGGVTEH
ncbi:hypothetical protein G6F37_005769 [Rhizopus arrhizus]|nr:hypothetical protein G6F38_001129 [Rhizopus arrhizus]KAG1158459.1 hypothetical protein G6F37_005769 [Rhizopus arrhizus]